MNQPLGHVQHAGLAVMALLTIVCIVLAALGAPQ